MGRRSHPRRPPRCPGLRVGERCPRRPASRPPRPQRPPSAHSSGRHSSRPATPVAQGSAASGASLVLDLLTAAWRGLRLGPGGLGLETLVHWMRLGEATAIGWRRWRWGWRERLAAASELGPGQWAPRGGLWVCPSPGPPVHPPAGAGGGAGGPEGVGGPGGARRRRPHSTSHRALCRN